MLDTVNEGSTGSLVALARAALAAGHRFVTPTPATHARVVARPDRGVARSVRDVLGWSLPFAPDLLPPALLGALRAADAVVPAGDGLLRATLRLSTLGGAAFLHSAYPTAAAESVFFGPDTYRFADAIGRLTPASPVRRAVDIGCGAGPGAILLARDIPGAEVFGVDINPAALRLARANAALAGVPVTFLESDLLTAVPGAFDLIVANPPYMADPARRAYRDGGGKLGAALSLKILDSAIGRLAPGGTLLLYTGAAMIDGADPFHDAAGARLAGHAFDWTYREADPDVFGEELDRPAYADAERIAAVVLTATRKG